jgi:hypothetical protein
VKVSMPVLSSVLSVALLSGLPVLASAQTLGTPGNITATVESCNGKYYVTWSAVTNATTYDILVEWPGSTSFVLLKATANAYTTVTAENATLDTNFEIQACDSSGCGTPTNSFALAYYAGCP